MNPARLKLARQRRGLTQTALAERISVERRTIVAFESDAFQPSNETLTRIANELDFPVGFFSGDDLEVPVADEVSFRSMSKMKAGHRDMALAQGALAIQLSNWIGERFSLPLTDLPDLSQEPSPEEAAIALRYAWGWGEKPVKNMIHLLESKGVKVFSLSIDSRNVDAFSLWKDQTPLVFLNTMKSAERSRFDAAHELGHLVLHRHASPEGRQAEQDADSFASAFLMPSRSVIAHAPRFSTLDSLMPLKHIWNVSITALVYRMHKLQLISDWGYRSLYIEMGELGYRVQEPEPSPPEASLVLDKVFAALRPDGDPRLVLSKALKISEREVEELTYGPVLANLSGGRKNDKASETGERPKLRAVK